MIVESHGYEYISVSWAGTSKSGKTHIYSVTNNKSGEELGTIKWYAQWRQYVFVPENSLYSRGCLADIQDFMECL
jgi:hypothetical protein